MKKLRLSYEETEHSVMKVTSLVTINDLLSISQSLTPGKVVFVSRGTNGDITAVTASLDDIADIRLEVVEE
jgi:hypothetical protein